MPTTDVYGPIEGNSEYYKLSNGVTVHYTQLTNEQLRDAIYLIQRLYGMDISLRYMKDEITMAEVNRLLEYGTPSDWYPIYNNLVEEAQTRNLER